MEKKKKTILYDDPCIEQVMQSTCPVIELVALGGPMKSWY